MRVSSLIVLVLALLFGLGAVFATKQYLASQVGIVSPAVATAAPATLVVAAQPLRFGDHLTADNLKEIPWSSGNIPPGAFASRDEVFKEEGDRYVLTALEANEPVLGWRITGPGQRASLSAVVEEGKKAVTIRVDDVLGVAGFVLPNDRVDILLTRKDAQPGGGGSAFVDVLLQGVKVLAIDQVADERSDDPVVVKAVTLEVDTEQAQKLTLAANVGQLSLALRNMVQNKAENTRRVTLRDLNGEPENAVPTTESAPAVVAPATPRFATVGVIRGMERDEYEVQLD